MFKFIKSTSIAVILRFIVNLIVIKLLFKAYNNANYIAEFNNFINYFSVFMTFSTMSIGSIIVNRNKILKEYKEWDNDYKTIILFGFYSTFASILFLITQYLFGLAGSFVDMIIVAILLLPNYVSHIYLNDNNANLKYQINNNITIATYLLILFCALTLLYLSKHFIVFKYLYLTILVFPPIINLILFDKSKLSIFLSLFYDYRTLLNFKNIFYRNKYLKQFIKDTFFIVIITLSPLYFYFILKWCLARLNLDSAINEIFEITYRYYTIVLSLGAIFFTSYLIPVLNKNSNTIIKARYSKYLAFILLIPILYISFHAYYYFVTSKVPMLNFNSILILIIFCLKFFQFIFFQYALYNKKYKKILYFVIIEIFLFCIFSISTFS